MAVTERDLQRAEAAMETLRQAGHAVAARYDRRRHRILVALHSGVEISVPVALAEGLADAPREALAEIEIAPSGLGLHWPQLDVDLYVPALLNGVFGSEAWMARTMGEKGGRARSAAKTAAARRNGMRGGRPRKTTAAA